jgi:hypothetical protein
MARHGTPEQQALVDVGAAFIEQARKDGHYRKYVVAFMRLYFRKYPRSRPFVNVSSFCLLHVQSTRLCSLSYCQVILKEMVWQRHAWGRSPPPVHWMVWCTLADEERDMISVRSPGPSLDDIQLIFLYQAEMHSRFRTSQLRLKYCELDDLFHVPGSCAELAIEVGSDDDDDAVPLS